MIAAVWSFDELCASGTRPETARKQQFLDGVLSVTLAGAFMRNELTFTADLCFWSAHGAGGGLIVLGTLDAGLAVGASHPTELAFVHKASECSDELICNEVSLEIVGREHVLAVW